eukprot:588767-Prorocentrum_minimum.AAC.1
MARGRVEGGDPKATLRAELDRIAHWGSLAKPRKMAARLQLLLSAVPEENVHTCFAASDFELVHEPQATPEVNLSP